jgi:hypothetical protein
MHLSLLEEGSLPCLALLFILCAIGARAVFRFLREEPEPKTADVIDRGDSSVRSLQGETNHYVTYFLTNPHSGDPYQATYFQTAR